MIVARKPQCQEYEAITNKNLKDGHQVFGLAGLAGLYMLATHHVVRCCGTTMMLHPLTRAAMLVLL